MRGGTKSMEGIWIDLGRDLCGEAIMVVVCGWIGTVWDDYG